MTPPVPCDGGGLKVLRFEKVLRVLGMLRVLGCPRMPTVRPVRAVLTVIQSSRDQTYTADSAAGGGVPSRAQTDTESGIRITRPSERASERWRRQYW
ncbi:hypothetical protein GCM10022245_08260 [Streptomyces mayteni]